MTGDGLSEELASESMPNGKTCVTTWGRRSIPLHSKCKGPEAVTSQCHGEACAAGA